MTRHRPSDLPPPHGLFEAHLEVRELDRSIAFYRDLVGLELAHVLPERQVAFFWIGGPGHAMLGLWVGSSSPQAMRLHLAFALALEAVLASPAALSRAGVGPLNFHGQPTTEPSVIGWMPAASVFFHDPDGHLLEYLAMLPMIEANYAKFIPEDRTRYALIAAPALRLEPRDNNVVKLRA